MSFSLLRLLLNVQVPGTRRPDMRDIVRRLSTLLADVTGKSGREKTKEEAEEGDVQKAKANMNDEIDRLFGQFS